MTLTVDGPAMMCPSQQKTFRPGWTSHTIRSFAGRLRARALLASASGEIMAAPQCLGDTALWASGTGAQLVGAARS